MKASTAIAFAAIVASLLVLTKDAAAHHRWFLVDNPWQNNGGMTTNFGYLWGGNIAWILGSGPTGAPVPLGICNDWNVYDYNAMPQGIRDAVASWEARLGGTQFSPGCGVTGFGLNFGRSTTNPSTYQSQCGTAAWIYACTAFSSYPSPPPYEPVRLAYYPHSFNVWFNTTNWTNWTNNGYKATAAHELGHVFGLDEQYKGLPDHGSCPGGYLQCQNPANVSIMDVATSTGHVDGVYAPTTYNNNNVGSFFWLMPIGGNIVSQGSVPGAIYINFTDLSYVESSYYMAAYFCCNSSGQPVLKHAWYHTAGVGKRGVVNGVPYYRGSNPVGFYQLCGYTYNTVSCYMHWSCSNWYWVP